MADTPDTPETATKAAEGKDAKKAKNGKKGGKKDKKGKGADGGLSVAGHPRAAAAVRRAKGFGGIAGFLLAALLAHGAGLSTTHTLERALVAGVAGYLLAWACAVTVWRQILIAQLRAFAAQQVSAAPPVRRTLSVAATVDDPAPEPAAPAPAE